MPCVSADNIRQLYRYAISKSQITRQRGIGRTSVRRILAALPGRKKFNVPALVMQARAIRSRQSKARIKFTIRAGSTASQRHTKMKSTFDLLKF